MVAAPVFVSGSANNAVTAAGTTHSVVVNTPAGIAAGHVLIAYVYGASGALATIPTPSGWALVGTVQAGAASVGGGGWFTKVATGSEPSTYTFSYTTTATIAGYPSATVTAWSSAAGVDAGPVFTALATTSTSAIAPAVTAVADHTALLCAYGNFTGVASFTPPSGMTTRASTFNSGNVDNVVASLDLAATGTTGTKTGTWNAASSGLWSSLTIAGSVVAVAGPVRRIGKRR